MRQALSILSILVVIGAGGYVAFQNLVPEPATTTAQGPVYATAPVERGPVRMVVQGTGPLNPVYGGNITADIEGTIQSVQLNRGDEVSEGQVVATIQNDEIGFEVEQLQNQLQDVRQELADVFGVPAGEVASLSRNASIQLKATIAGRLVLSEAIEEGGTVEPGDTFGRIVDDQTVVIEAELAPGIREHLEEGTRAWLRLEQFAGDVKASVTDINPHPIPRGDRFVYAVTITAANPGLLQPGQKVDLRFETGEGIVGVPETQTISRYGQETEVKIPLLSGLTENPTITSLPVRSGEIVEAGAVLAELGGVGVQAYLESKRAEIADLQQQLAEQQQVREQLTIRSPYAGTVNQIYVRPGDQVEPGRPVASIFDSGKMNLNFTVDELDVVHLKEGQQAEITVEALPDRTFTAEVGRIDRMGQTEEGFAQYLVFMEVDNTQGVQPGMTANVHILVDQVTGALRIPVEAVFNEGDRTFVEILTEEGPQTVEVETGLMNDRWVEVTSGLEEGQRVITGSSQDRLNAQEPEDMPGFGLPGQEGQETEAAPAGSSGSPSGSSSGGGVEMPAREGGR